MPAQRNTTVGFGKDVIDLHAAVGIDDPHGAGRHGAEAEDRGLVYGQCGSAQHDDAQDTERLAADGHIDGDSQCVESRKRRLGAQQGQSDQAGRRHDHGHDDKGPRRGRLDAARPRLMTRTRWTCDQMRSHELAWTFSRLARWVPVQE